MSNSGVKKISKARKSDITKRLMEVKTYNKQTLAYIIDAKDDDDEIKIDHNNVEFRRDSDYLYALLWSNGPKERIQKDCEKLVHHLGGLGPVFSASFYEIDAACLELDLKLPADFIRRRLDSALHVEQKMWLSRAKRGPIATNFNALVQYLVKSFAAIRREEVRLVYLDRNKVLTGVEVVAIGQTTQVHVELKQILAHVLRAGATSFIISHNHPSEDIAPSEADIAFTRQIAGAAMLLEIPLEDHIIIAGNDWLSFRVAGLL